MSALRRSACGGCRLDLNGTHAVARVSGALWLPQTRTLAAGDLHLEKGSAYGVRGQHLPPYDTAATLDRLIAEVSALAPARLVLMGDSFHDRGAATRLDETAVARLNSLAERVDLVWLSGNHDPAPPEGLAGKTVEHLEVGPLALTHEPSPEPVEGEVAGHLHPVATVKGYGARVRRRCFLTDGRRMILPAFGAYAGGLNVTDPAFHGLFADASTALILGDDRVHALPMARLSVSV
ncbi:MAG: ligase-associated DNA damage response endonuclease PdeM [Caulobacterales bacterium]|nr:ligase-associated DNA damage response endonuclease PdeM [Caulobacterales bacterium]